MTASHSCSKLSIIGVFGLVALAPQFAYAQASDTAEEAGKGGDIIVTARKRQESALKVPVIATVLSLESIEKAQIVDILGVTQQVPGLVLGTSVLSVGTQIALRGVGTSSLDAGIDQSVSINIDGMQFSQGTTFNVGLFDMQQIEVLKGPQALFFGKSSPGGAISIRTADPGNHLEVIARGSYELEAHGRRGELIVSGPMTETLGVRIAGMVSGDDGYFFNKAIALPGTGAKDPSSSRYNSKNDYIIRGTLVWKPVNEFSARLKVNHAQSKMIGGGLQMRSCPDGVGAPLGIPFIAPNEDCKLDRDIRIVDLDPAAFPGVSNNGVPFMEHKLSFGTLEMKYAVSPNVSLNATTGYFNTTVDGMINATSTGNAGPAISATHHFTRRDFTQEVRLESDFQDKPVNYLLGAYYQSARIYVTSVVGGNTALRLPGLLTRTGKEVNIETISLFGQLRWKPVSEVEVALGARWTDEKRDANFASATTLTGDFVPTLLAKPHLSSKNVSPELTITYTPTDELTFFGALKQGYKSGSFTITGSNAGNDPSFGDERVRGGEIGIKSRLADRSLSLNAAFYYYNYSNLQVGGNEAAANGLPVIRTVNAGRSRVYGIDFDASYRPPEVAGLSLRLAINWNNARFARFDNAPCIGGETIGDGCNLFLNPVTGRFNAQDLSDQPLPKAADWTMDGGFDYEL
ncbi:MAG: TonB-dependent receptor, partial [Burkholderiales bacterium]